MNFFTKVRIVDTV